MPRRKTSFSRDEAAIQQLDFLPIARGNLKRESLDIGEYVQEDKELYPPTENISIDDYPGTPLSSKLSKQKEVRVSR